MKSALILFLQVILVLIGLGALGLLLWEPHLEGVNAHATTLREIYFDDPFLALVYVGSIPFFVAIYQAVRLLGYIRENNAFAPAAVRSLRTIKYAALAVVGFVAFEELFIILTHGDDDAAGAIMLGLIIALVALVAAVAAAVFERVLHHAVELKSENDLTV